MSKKKAFYPYRSAEAKEAFQARMSHRAEEWPIPSETLLLETPSAQTHVRISGQPDAPNLVLLHGSRGNSLMWIPNITAFAAHYRTFALDSIFDLTLSTHRVDRPNKDFLVEWLAEVTDALASTGPLYMVGMSYGGWLASQFALHYPDRLDKLVLLAPAATVLPVSFRFLSHAIWSVLPGIRFRQKFYYWLLADGVASGSEGKHMIDQAIADWDLAERSFVRLPLINATVLTDEMWHQLERVPTLYLVGENEKVYAAEKAVARLNQVAPRIQTEMVPNAGHDVWMSQAEHVNKAILDFLTATTAS